MSTGLDELLSGSGPLTPEQILELSKLSPDEIMSGSSTDDTAPVVEQAPEDGEDPDQASSEPEQPPEQAPVVLAKDGVNTIPYSVLEAERAQKSALQQRIAELEATALQAQQASAAAPAPQFDPDTGLTEEQSARLREIEEASDFSATAQAKAQLFVAKCHAENGVIAPQQSAELQQVQAELNALKAEKLESAHKQQILASHPDAASIVDSTGFAQWIDGLPSYARAGALHVRQNGNANEVNQLLADYKASRQSASDFGAASTTTASKAAAAAAISRAAKPAIPASLSDVAAGTKQSPNELEDLLNTNAAVMSSRLAQKSPEQIRAFLDRNL